MVTYLKNFFQTTFTPDGILKFPSWSIHARTHARTHGPECRARTSSKFLDQLLRRHFNFRPFFPPIRRHNVLTLSERFDLARVLYATHTLTRSASQGSVRKLFGVCVAINFFLHSNIELFAVRLLVLRTNRNMSEFRKQ